MRLTINTNNSTETFDIQEDYSAYFYTAALFAVVLFGLSIPLLLQGLLF